MKSTGKKSERLNQLELLLLSHPEGMRRAEIARRLGVHRATAGRYIDELSLRIPIWEKDFLVGIKKGQVQDLNHLGLLESVTFFLALRYFAENIGMHFPQGASAVRKVASLLQSFVPFLSDRLVEISDVLDTAPQDADSQQICNLELLSEAWITRKRVDLAYCVDGETLQETCLVLSVHMESLDHNNFPPIVITVQRGPDMHVFSIFLKDIRTVNILLSDQHLDGNLPTVSS